MTLLEKYKIYFLKGFAYDHDTFRVFVNGTEQEPSCRVATRGTVFPIFYVDEGEYLIKIILYLNFII